jgi:hypothetical protein
MSTFKNQAADSRPLDESAVEQRALQIARLDSRELITDDDRTRAREELLTPEDTTPPIEVTGSENEETILDDIADHGARGPGSL